MRNKTHTHTYTHTHTHTHTCARTHTHTHIHTQHRGGCRPVYPSFHLSVLWAEVVSNPRCLSVIHTLHFSLLYSYLTQCFRQLYSQLIFTQTKIVFVTNEGSLKKCNSILFKLLLETPIDPWIVMITSLDN